MLLLGRKTGQVILIGEAVRLTIVKAANGRATIGIEAPADVKILRDDAKNKEAKAA